MNIQRILFALALLLFPATGALAGGPLLIAGPSAGSEQGLPFTFDAAAMPIQYRVDGGPLAQSNVITVNNQQGLDRVRQMFDVWQQAPATAIRYNYAGAIQPVAGFSDSDVSTIEEFSAVEGSCVSGTQTVVIFDANGSVLAALGVDDAVIGFASPCKLDFATHSIKTAFAFMNGKMQDGIDTSTNFELSAQSFNEAIVHEIGHFSGLDHSQINLASFTIGNCNAEDLAGMPLMFPIHFCNERSSFSLPMLAPDDIAWISKLYPSPGFATSYGLITGHVLFSDGLSHAQGVNVIARKVGDPKRVAVSVVSGYSFTANPGQTLTATYLKCVPTAGCPGGFAGNNPGSQFGSRKPLMIGYFEIPVPPGKYTVEVENIYFIFNFGSSVGPLDPPVSAVGTPEFWNIGESRSDSAAAVTEITVAAGQTVTDVDIILNGTVERFDSLESGAWLLMPDALLRRRDELEEA